MRNILIGTCTAVAVTFTLAFPRVAGMETWKIALALVGVALFVLAGRGR